MVPLIGRLKDPDWLVRQCAAEALGSIRAEPNQAIPALIESMNDENLNVRRCRCNGSGCDPADHPCSG